MTYPDLPDWDGPPWSLLLTPGWRELSGRPLAEIAARQWAAATSQLLDDLEALPPRRQIPELRRFRALSWSDKVAALSAREG